MPSKRRRRAEIVRRDIVRRDIVRLIITTRERFPHTPRLTRALRRVMWRYVSAPPPASKRKHVKRPVSNIKRDDNV
jgi:hypothetical protein